MSPRPVIVMFCVAPGRERKGKGRERGWGILTRAGEGESGGGQAGEGMVD